MKIRSTTLVCFLLLTYIHGLGQYRFKDDIRIPCTPVKNQHITGTCWSFSAISFLESELLRTGAGNHDLSEMYFVRYAYLQKAKNYLLRQGKANFSEGGLAHDVMGIIEQQGIVPQETYPGLTPGDSIYDHRKLVSSIKSFLDSLIQTQTPEDNWIAKVEEILNDHLGDLRNQFSWSGKKYKPETYKSHLGINPSDYANITSFTHHPFYQYFVLEIPDNYSNGQYFNVKLEEMMNAIDKALEKGYSILWDGDVSEPGFAQELGVAVLSGYNISNDSSFNIPVEDTKVDQEIRQLQFFNYQTTDDHLMHIIGRAKDQNNQIYYIIKNSWGAIGPYGGFLYMSKPYLKLKTVAITLHKDALPEKIRERL